MNPKMLSEASTIGTRRPRLPALSALFVFMSAIAVPAAAQLMPAENPADLYGETVIVTGSDLRYRARGFAEAFRVVLVKVSGEPRLDRDPRVQRLAGEADLFIGSFDYVDQLTGIKHHDDQGTYDRPFNLTVNFVPALINKALSDLGERPWLPPRPVVVPVLAIRGFNGVPYLLSAGEPAAAQQRGAFLGAAGYYGVVGRIPDAPELSAWHVTAATFPNPPPAASPGEIRVAGTLEFDRRLPGWVGSWKMRWAGVEYAWGIRGVNYDEAFRDVVRGVIRVASGHGAPD